jgi:diadenosine tetraphosphate (Ap4A) HIT family hydrolase
VRAGSSSASSTAPDDPIVRTDTWDVVHADDTALPGWLVLVARRHLTAVADLTEAEATELGSLLRTVSRALHVAVGCEKTYIVQFAEHPLHPHVHVHVIPRMADQASALRGPNIFSLLGVPKADRVPEAQMDEIAAVVRREPHDRSDA